MEQLNIKTKEEKTMRVFTTNWYLYKTYLHPFSTKSQKRNSGTETESYGTKKEKRITVRESRLKREQWTLKNF